jgi:hypothetical protein
MNDRRDQTTEVSRALPQSILWQDCFGEEYDRRFDEAGIDPDDHKAVEEFMNDAHYLWNVAVMEEPCMAALGGFLGFDDYWVGTEEELFERVKSCTSRETREAGPFPSTPEELMRHIDQVGEYSWGFETDVCDYNVLDRREFTKDEAFAYWAKGWSPERPIMVRRLGTAYRPDYYTTMMRLAEYESPLLLAVLKSTENKQFWHGNTSKMAHRLQRYYPLEATDPWIYTWDDFSEFPLVTGTDLLDFYNNMVSCAPILEEFGIEVTREKRPGERTWWTIEAPRWDFGDEDQVTAMMAHMTRENRKRREEERRNGSGSS